MSKQMVSSLALMYFGRPPIGHKVVTQGITFPIDPSNISYMIFRENYFSCCIQPTDRIDDCLDVFTS